MSDPVIITWNVTNWVTIFLMAVLGFVLIGAMIKAYQDYKAKQAG